MLDRRSGFATPGSHKEYLFILLSNALAALQRGDYAIGANSLFSQSDPRGHAEANALGKLLALGRSKPSHSLPRIDPWPGVSKLRGIASGLFVRTLRHFEDPASSILYTSLEPCPMCTVVALNAGVQRVCVAGPDPWAGSLSEDGVHDMPPLWAKIQEDQGLRVQYLDKKKNVDREVPHLAELVGVLFIATKGPLDGELAGGGLLSLGRLTGAIDHFAAKRSG
jgi:tRNA(Arg) A34 adenosine deaminase TadA